MPAEVRSGLSGMNTSLGDPQESGGPPENSRPKEIITLGPGESVRQVILKKIQELSDSLPRGLRLLEPHSFTRAIADCRSVFEMGREVGHDTSLLDVGGGFPGAEGSEPEFEEMARVINAALAQDFPEGNGVEVTAEPGRFYAASVCTAAVNITAKKAVLEPGGYQKRWHYLNEGYYGTFRIFLSEPLPRMPTVVKELCSEQPIFPCVLYGPTCDAFDKLFKEEVQLPELDVGDWLIFPSMGAYTFVMSSTFNDFLPASIYYTMGPELRSLLETAP